MPGVYVLYIIIAVIIILCIIGSFYLASILYRKVFLRENVPFEFKSIDVEKNESEELNNFILDNVKKFTFDDIISIPAFDGYDIKAYFKKGEAKTKNYIISIPGYELIVEKNYGLHSYIYDDLKFNMVYMENRGNPMSPCEHVTFGLQESKDLLSMINYLIKTYGQDISIILDGLSMGAYMALSNASSYPKQVKGIIADSSYTSVYDELNFLLKKEHIILPIRKLTLWSLNNKVIGNFNVNMKKHNTLVELKKTSIPVCFIYSSGDRIVDDKFSIKNKNACISESYLYNFPFSKHFYITFEHEKLYKSTTYTFIEKCLKSE